MSTATIAEQVEGTIASRTEQSLNKLIRAPSPTNRQRLEQRASHTASPRWEPSCPTSA